MLCPNCNVANLIIQNANYYCPGCKMYIGSVKDHPQGFISKTTPRDLDQVIQDIPVKASQDENFKYYIGNYIVPGFIITFIIGLFFLLPNFFHYLSFSPYCNIQIEGKKNFKENITTALNFIKVQDQTEYQDICKYVSNIEEGVCPVSDEGETGTTNARYEDHCYIKGSKIIYLNNSEDLELTAGLSKNYWEKQR